MSYKVKLEIFEGPLDLLLYLIKKDEINIYDIPIAKIAEEYLQYLEIMQMLDLNIAGEFLLMAATLMHIKSRMLLPAEELPEEPLEEEDPRRELARKLMEYKRFKEAAQHLEEIEQVRKEVFRAGINEPLIKDSLKEEEPFSFFEATLFDLISAFSTAIEGVKKEDFFEVMADEFTVPEKIHDILHLFVVQSKVKLSELFKMAKNRLDVITTFLAILELIRINEIRVFQEKLFDEILIIRNPDNIRPKVKRSI